MSKVTNNENMRRYVHMKLSNGGSGSGSGGSCTCLSPMVVEGTVNDNEFIPESGAPTFEEAYNHMVAGGLVYLKLMFDNNTNFMVVIASAATSNAITTTVGGNTLVWTKNEDEDPDESPE